MRSLALTLFALTTLAAGCGPHETTPASPAATSAPAAAEPAPVEPAPPQDPPPQPEPRQPETPQPVDPAAQEHVPMDPLTGPPPEHLVKAYREGQLKLPKPPRLHTEKTNACRSPAEPGCAQCCNKSKPTACYGQHGSSEPPDNGSPPWFNAGGKLSDGPCPGDCKPCAQCTLREEWELSQARIPDPQCDCTKTYPGIDHCFNPTSCGCVCGRIRGLIERCPHLHPARANSNPATP